MSKNIAIWWDVPNGSTINLSVDDQASDILARARVVRTDDSSEQFQHGDLVPGPKAEPVQNNLSYTIRPSIIFQGSEIQSATIHAQVLGPGGDPIADSNGEESYSYVAQGKAGDEPVRTTLSIINKDG